MMVVKKLRDLWRLLRVTGRGKLFDPKWYCRQHPEISPGRISAFYHFWRTRQTGSSSYDFNAPEYLALNWDVMEAKVPALVHYLAWGRYQHRQTSTLEDECGVVFPDDAVEAERDFAPFKGHCRRVCVFSSYSGNGSVHSYVLGYLKGLRKVCDWIVFVSDSPLKPESFEKLSSLAERVVARRHGQYDFRSYAIGIDWLRRMGVWENFDELVLCNDSCYGPFIPFEEQFAKLKDMRCDFWGQTQLDSPAGPFVQSYFFVFRRSLLDSDVFKEFWDGCLEDLPPPIRANTVALREMRMTRIFVRARFSFVTWIPFLKGFNMSYKSAQGLLDYRMPLVKIKCYGDHIRSYDSPEQIMAAMMAADPELAKVAVPHFQSKMAAQERSFRAGIFRIPSIAEHRATFPRLAAAACGKLARGERIRVAFPTGSALSLWQQSVFDAFASDERFSARIVVNPGCNDLTGEDIVFYPTPADCRNPYLSVRGSVGHGILPVLAEHLPDHVRFKSRDLEMDAYRLAWRTPVEGESASDVPDSIMALLLNTQAKGNS